MPPRSPDKSTRVSIIESVKSPLGVFALVILVVESVIGLLAQNTPVEIRGWIILALILLLAIVVALVAWLSFRGALGNSAHYSVVLSLPGELANLNATKIVWDSTKCFLNWPGQQGKRVPIVPALGPFGPAFEVRLPREVMANVPDSAPIDFELADKKGIRWIVKPFYVHQRATTLFCVSDRTDLVKAYGDEE